MKTLPHFLSLPYDPDIVIHKILDNPNHEHYEDLMTDLASLNPRDLEEYCIENDINLFIERERDKDLARKIWFINHLIRVECAKERKRLLLAPPQVSYDMLRLTSLPMDDNGLVSIKNFTRTYHGVVHNGNAFQLSPSLSQFNSAYWLFDLILQAAYDHDIDCKIRLNPFIRIPEQEYEPMVFKMQIYGIKLDWERIKGLQNEEDGMWVRDSFSDATIDRTEYVWSPTKGEIHFTCEELPKKEALETRGSRYFHAIINKKTGLVIHCDGAIRYYTEEQLEYRNRFHVKKPEVIKAGTRVKIFQIDQPISQILFMSLATTFMVWNQDTLEYFN